MARIVRHLESTNTKKLLNVYQTISETHELISLRSIKRQTMLIFADFSLCLSGVIHCKHADNQCWLIYIAGPCKNQKYVSIFHIT